jgi:hypothetical protein
MPTPVNVDNFARAETARMFDNTLQLTGGVNRWYHYRAPTPVDSQPVIRMNRDTLYSAAIVDLSQGARVTLPDTAGRYMTVMVVDEDHYDNLVLSGPGDHELTPGDCGTRYVNLSVRTFVDPADPHDVAEVNALQNAIGLHAASAEPYTHPDYDPATLDATRAALARLSDGIPDAVKMFGKEHDVDPVHHLIGTAAGWGGLPASEAYYYFETQPRPVGDYTFTFEDVPVDAFWSLAIYNRDGYFESNPYNSFGMNSVTATPDHNGVVTIRLSPDDRGSPNHVYVMDGWNYVLRLYKPHQSVLDKTWTPPTPILIDTNDDTERHDHE